MFIRWMDYNLKTIIFYVNKYYLQIKVAPTYATLVLGSLVEENVRWNMGSIWSWICKLHTKSIEELPRRLLLFWNRSCDDLMEFHNLLNKRHKSFTHDQTNDNELLFLVCWELRKLFLSFTRKMTVTSFIFLNPFIIYIQKKHSFYG